MTALILAALLQPSPGAAHAAEARAASTLFAAVNAERRARGVPPLALDPQLTEAALEHVQDMARKRYFAHVSPSGVTPFDRMRAAGCVFLNAAENIALAGDEARADRALFASEPHRRNTLNSKYTRIGVAAMFAADGRMLFVEDFSD
jgi:uncharacterized protein YkwD